jgi:hypothetical protein
VSSIRALRLVAARQRYERNLVIFRRDGSGKVVELIERRKFNDLHLKRAGSQTKG